ncbi:MAG TPA: hypothetical protein QF572_13540 [Vicinamibacterales bacterium]|jgi:hypothetical protein|nr:hypothetical protein [Vicinamibacterales bacterium]|tara:strand:+ start:529 stop:1077 length:549 start_codon:yes stop_codon:yes gene_type:complete
MRRLNLTALLGSVVVVMLSVGCAGGEAADSVEVAAPAVEIGLRELLDSQPDSRLVAAMRGPGQVGYLQPRSRRDGNDMVTTFRIKNISTGALAGFKVDEFWYDDAGDTVTGGSFRKREPFLPEEVIEVELRIPRNSRMSRSNYEFSHQNGLVEANLFDEMEEPTPMEEAAEETDAAAETPAR